MRDTKSAMRAASSSGRSPCTLWPAPSTTTTSAAGWRRRSSATSASSTTGETPPRTRSNGTSTCDRTSQSGEGGGSSSSAGRLAASGCGPPPPVVVPGPRAVRQGVGVVEDPAPERRLAAGRVVLDRPGQDGVEARRSVCGPSTKSMMACALRRLTPGVMSTSTSRRTSSGHRAASAVAVMPPSDMPTTAAAWGARRSTALRDRLGQVVRAVGAVVAPAEWPCPGRSKATSGRSRARATVSHVCAFIARAVEEHELRRADVGPHTSALEGAAARQRDVLSSYDRWPGPREPELGGVLLEQAELVVRGRVHGAHHRGGRRPWSAVRCGPLVGAVVLLAACSGSGTSSGTASLVPPAQASAPATGAVPTDVGAPTSLGSETPAPSPSPTTETGPPATAPPLADYTGDPFFDAGDTPPGAPGDIIRSRPVTVAIDGARRGRSSTGPARPRTSRSPSPPPSWPRPPAPRRRGAVLAWAHGTTGMGDQCSISAGVADRVVIRPGRRRRGCRPGAHRRPPRLPGPGHPGRPRLPGRPVRGAQRARRHPGRHPARRLGRHTRFAGRRVGPLPGRTGGGVRGRAAADLRARRAPGRRDRRGSGIGPDRGRHAGGRPARLRRLLSRWSSSASGPATRSSPRTTTCSATPAGRRWPQVDGQCLDQTLTTFRDEDPAPLLAGAADRPAPLAEGTGRQPRRGPAHRRADLHLPRWRRRPRAAGAQRRAAGSLLRARRHRPAQGVPGYRPPLGDPGRHFATSAPT